MSGEGTTTNRNGQPRALSLGVPLVSLRVSTRETTTVMEDGSNYHVISICRRGTRAVAVSSYSVMSKSTAERREGGRRPRHYHDTTVALLRLRRWPLFRTRSVAALTCTRLGNLACTEPGCHGSNSIEKDENIRMHAHSQVTLHFRGACMGNTMRVCNLDAGSTSIVPSSTISTLTI